MASHGDPYPPHSLPRLDPSCYQADAAVLWTLTTRDRAKGWLSEKLHLQFRELLLHVASREGLFCPVYTLMPDHLHFAWLGVRVDSDQRNAIAFLRTHLTRLLTPIKLQPQNHDHVLTKEERTQNAFAQICQYIQVNPVRAMLAKTPEEWPHTGCIIPGYAGPTPYNPDYWPWFWKVYYAHRDRACDHHVTTHKLYNTKSKSP
jgi:putative transposase